MPRFPLHGFRPFAIAALLGLGASLTPKPVLALDRNVKSVFIISAYGLAAGTIVGLVTLPLTQDARAVFIGSSVGLYLGIAVGIYHVLNRTDPQNPLYTDPSKPQTELELRPGMAWVPAGYYSSLQSGYATPRPAFQLKLPVIRF